MLRQESNVDLGTLTLEGTTTRRQVTHPDRDGRGGRGLGGGGGGTACPRPRAVPSRASIPQSPFRFIVLGDQCRQWIQPRWMVSFSSAELATFRQVIVLSHDDRLSAAAARRAQWGHASSRSREETTPRCQSGLGVDPARRYLSDAFRLAMDEAFLVVVACRTLPGMLRFAVEATCRDLVYERRLTRGEPLADVEALWSRHHATRRPSRSGPVRRCPPLDGWLVGGYRKFGLGIITGAMHDGLPPPIPRTRAEQSRMSSEISGQEAGGERGKPAR